MVELWFLQRYLYFRYRYGSDSDGTSVLRFTSDILNLNERLKGDFKLKNQSVKKPLSLFTTQGLG